MPIAFNRYVRITSGVGGAGAVRRRELIARLFTTSDMVPSNMVLEFSDVNSVRDYFGSTAEEFLRAQFYFSFVSKSITQPRRISFSRWASTASAPRIFGAMSQTLPQLQTITAGTFSLTLGSTTLNISGLNFSGDNSLSDVASALQTAIRAGTGTAFTGATVTYNANAQRFELTGGETGTVAISISAGSSNDAAAAIGWLGTAVLSPGTSTQTITNALAESAELTNNFGSFAFVPDLTEEQILEAATWNDGENVLYQYQVPVTAANAATMSAALINLGGTGLTLADRVNQPNEYPEMLPMAILAATNYQLRASVQNYMFQVGNLTPTVDTTTLANTYDNLRVNYYGSTQTAGVIRSFYQRGVLTGQATDPVDMNTYANEQWLKDDAGAAIMGLLLSLPRVSANQRGTGQLLSVIQSTIDQALINGTISVGRPLTQTQIIFISSQSGDPLAFQQVQTSGYWVNASLESFQTQDNRTEFRANYTLIYTQDNAIRMVDGRHILI